MTSDDYSLAEWYSALQELTSSNGQVGLPPEATMQGYYDAGYTIEDAYQAIYPPQPVTLSSETLEPVQQMDGSDQSSQELALAREIQESRVTEEDVLKRVVAKTFTMLPGGTTIVCELVLENGFVAHGQSILGSGEVATTSAQAKALQNAVLDVWDKEVYLAREKAYRKRLADIAKASIGITDQSNG